MKEGAGTAGFTLVELLVVTAIIGLLASLLLPGLTGARQSALKAACLSNLRQTGVAIHTYAGDNSGQIPYGPKAPPFINPADFYPSTGAPTTLLSLQNGAPVGLGLLLAQHLGSQARVLFCPAPDQPMDTAAELAKVGVAQAQGGYLYRHGGATNLFDPAGGPPPAEHLKLEALGTNRLGMPIQALVIDAMTVVPPELADFNLRSSTHHRQRFADILYSDGHAGSRRNDDGAYTEDLTNFADIRRGFDVILRVFERADAGP
jgi:prepilin-type N-terminal cleavage/methylation domain-containing protein